MRFLQSSWMAMLIGMLSYAGTTWFALRPNQLVAEIKAAREAAGSKGAGPLQPSWGFKNPEVDQVLEELREQRKALDVRAQQLDELEARLKSEQQEIATVTQRVATVQAMLDKTVLRVREEETANLKKLAKMYSAMTPAAAALIMNELEDDQAVAILGLMKETECALILEIIGKTDKEGARRAATISNRLRLLLLKDPTAKGPSS